MPTCSAARRSGLNKGEAHHALKRAIVFNRRGEIRDRTAEGQHYRVAGLNLLAAVIIYWNTRHLGDVVASSTPRRQAPVPDRSPMSRRSAGSTSPSPANTTGHALA